MQNQSKRSISLPPQQQQLDTRSNDNSEIYPSIKSTNTTFDTLRVVIRVRPPVQREIEDGLPFRSIVS